MHLEISGLFIVKGQPLTLGNAGDLWHIRLGAEIPHCSKEWQNKNINKNQNQEMYMCKKNNTRNKNDLNRNYQEYKLYIRYISTLTTPPSAGTKSTTSGDTVPDKTQTTHV